MIDSRQQGDRSTSTYQVIEKIPLNNFAALYSSAYTYYVTVNISHASLGTAKKADKEYGKRLQKKTKNAIECNNNNISKIQFFAAWQDIAEEIAFWSPLNGWSWIIEFFFPYLVLLALFGLL